jgi:hypothetical protein
MTVVLAELMFDFGNFHLAADLFLQATEDAPKEEIDRLMRQANRARTMAFTWGQR